MTDKSDDKVGHLNTILARGGGNLNDPIFKSSNARGLPGGGMLKFRVDRRIRLSLTLNSKRKQRKHNKKWKTGAVPQVVPVNSK